VIPRHWRWWSILLVSANSIALSLWLFIHDHHRWHIGIVVVMVLTTAVALYQLHRTENSPTRLLPEPPKCIHNVVAVVGGYQDGDHMHCLDCDTDLHDRQEARRSGVTAMSNKDRAVQKNVGWRQAMPDMRERADALIAALDAQGATQDGDVVRRLLHLLDSREANTSAEERAAWDEYVAALLARDGIPELAEQIANEMLERRRQRFSR
jgi:hypothetical protein